MGHISVLSLKKKMDGKGEYFEVIMDLDGKFTRCFLRSGLGRNELLRKLYSLSTIEELYLIDQKAVLYIA